MLISFLSTNYTAGGAGDGPIESLAPVGRVGPALDGAETGVGRRRQCLAPPMDDQQVAASVALLAPNLYGHLCSGPLNANAALQKRSVSMHCRNGRQRRRAFSDSARFARRAPPVEVGKKHNRFASRRRLVAVRAKCAGKSQNLITFSSLSGESYRYSCHFNDLLLLLLLPLPLPPTLLDNNRDKCSTTTATRTTTTMENIMFETS